MRKLTWWQKYKRRLREPITILYICGGFLLCLIGSIISPSMSFIGIPLICIGFLMPITDRGE